MLNPRLDDLIRYPLERLVAARDGIAAAALVPDNPRERQRGIGAPGVAGSGGAGRVG